MSWKHGNEKWTKCRSCRPLSRHPPFQDWSRVLLDLNRAVCQGGFTLPHTYNTIGHTLINVHPGVYECDSRWPFTPQSYVCNHTVATGLFTGFEYLINVPCLPPPPPPTIYSKHMGQSLCRINPKMIPPELKHDCHLFVISLSKRCDSFRFCRIGRGRS